MKAGELLGPRIRIVAWILVLTGVAAFLAALKQDPARAWGVLLFSNFYAISLSLAGGVFIASQYASSGTWSTIFRRVPEAMLAYVNQGWGPALFFLTIIFGAGTIYPWTHAGWTGGIPYLQGKAAYLSLRPVLLRAAIYFAIWIVLGRMLVRNSRLEDAAGGSHRYFKKNVIVSSVFLMLFAFSYSLASVDWTMSLSPHWTSTMYPWYAWASLFSSGLGLIALFSILLRRRGVIPNFNRWHLYDLAKLVFAFCGFWAYVWFDQYMLIWYGNIPEEAVYFTLRGAGSWGGFTVLFWGNFIVNFIIPFLAIISARQKKREYVMVGVALLLLAGHWLDFYLMVMPAVMKGKALLGWPEIAISLGVGALFLLAFDGAFKDAPPVPQGDPYLQDSLQHCPSY